MKNKLEKIILKILEENDLDTNVIITNDTNLINDLGFDSFSLALLTVEIEEEFGVDIYENKIIRTFGEIMEELK